MENINVTIENVTPLLAQAYLATSKGNRKLSDYVVAKYARMMSRGEWQTSSDCICFDEKGVLINGHHRLNAVIQSGKTVPLAIMRGVSHSAILTIDIGKSRTLTNVVEIAMPNTTNSMKKCALVRYLLACEVRKNTEIVYVQNKPITQNDVINFLKEHDVELAAAIHDVPKTINLVTLFRAFAYMVRHYNNEASKFFIRRYYDGVNLSADSPIMALRKKIHDVRAGGGFSYHLPMYYLFKAWNHFVAGDKKTCFVTPKEIHIPVPVGMDIAEFSREVAQK